MEKKTLKGRLDYTAMIIPLLGVVLLCVLFMIMPAKSSYIIQMIRGFLGNDCGIYYAMLGVGIFACSLYIAFSKYGKIKLGKDTDKPIYSSFNWGVMIFTSTMAADILFYSLCEWALYANEKYIDQLGGIQKWASTFPLFHWGPIAWSFYIILAVAFGFMLHVRGRNKQKFSEGCRPLLGNKVDGVVGKIIDLIAIFALIAGTATTFSLATPLLSAALSRVFGLPNGVGLTIAVLLLIAAVYTFTVITGMKGISKLATYCSYLFFALLIYFLIGGGETTYILETGFSAIGNMVQNFIGLSTWMDPLRETSFPQNWTIYYWAYWMVWCVAAPFFIGNISRGRTIRQTILGGYVFGVGSTLISFIILGNYSMGMQMSGVKDFIAQYTKTGDLYGMIVSIIKTMPFAPVIMIVVLVTMIAFYATSFDSIALTASCYSYHRLEEDKQPHKGIQLMWCILLILLPIALLFAKSSMSNLQSVSIVAAFPIGLVIVMIAVSFMKDAKKYIEKEIDETSIEQK